MNHKTLLILTGHTKGLGQAILEKFLSSEGVEIIAISRTTLKNKSSRVVEISLDLSDLDALETHLPKIFPKESVDRYVLINNAGRIGEIKPVGKLNPGEIQRVLNLNLIAPMILTNAFVKAYGSEAGSKIICNISSGAAHKPLSGWGEYCGSKAGLAMFSRVADEELKESGIRVFSLAPGIVDTEMQSEIRLAGEKDFPALKRFLDYKSEGLLSTPEEVAEKVYHLIQHSERFSDSLQDVRNF
jgi:benzil reductase ((S)-benzoin forming)